MLETMRTKGRPAKLQRLVVILMAPAIPTEFIQPGGKLHDAIQVPNSIAVFHSPADSVLSRYFGIGQSLAGEGILPEAVGLNGAPRNVPWTKVEHMRSYDHGDYWAELEMVEKVCRILGIQISPLAMSLPLATQKKLASSRLIAAEPLPGRSL
jgi:hypothetical protein